MVYLIMYRVSTIQGAGAGFRNHPQYEMNERYNDTMNTTHEDKGYMENQPFFSPKKWTYPEK